MPALFPSRKQKDAETRGQQKVQRVSSAGKAASGLSPKKLPRSLPYPPLFLRKYHFVKMSNAPRETRIFAAGRAANGKFASLTRRNWGYLSAESGFCLTGVHRKGSSCARGSGARQPSGCLPFFLPFRRKGFPRLNERNMREKARQNPVFRKNFNRNEDQNPATCGQLRRALRRRKVFLAVSGARPCGRETAILRDFWLIPANQRKQTYKFSFYLERLEESACQQNQGKYHLFVTKKIEYAFLLIPPQEQPG